MMGSTDQHCKMFVRQSWTSRHHASSCHKASLAATLNDGSPWCTHSKMLFPHVSHPQKTAVVTFDAPERIRHV